jgi:hypothetical protein
VPAYRRGPGTAGNVSYPDGASRKAGNGLLETWDVCVWKTAARLELAEVLALPAQNLTFFSPVDGVLC